MDFINFDELCQYVTNHSVEDMLFPVLKKQIILYQGAINDTDDVQKLISKLNKLTEGKYTIILGDTIHAEIIDIKENLGKVQTLYHEWLGDNKSKSVLFNILAYRLTRLERYILDAFSYDSEQYFDSSVTVFKEDCVYVDCGGLDGYTAAKFMLHCPSYKKIYLYEPMESYYQDCVENIKALQVNNIVLRQAAVADKNCILKFSANVKGSSKISDSGDIIVQAVTLDEDVSEPISFIKMDIEGSEKSALKGAEQHIKNDTPMLAICVYHLPSDLWEIPSIIAEMNPNYKFHFRHHKTNTDETVCYAIPNNYKVLPANDVTSLSPNTEVACLRFINKIENVETLDLLKSKVYLLKQVENYQRNNLHHLSVIKELKDWTIQLNDAKVYLEEQVNNQDNSITELKNWIKQLEEAKEYHLEKERKCEEELAKCRQTIIEQEQSVDILTNEKKKLTFWLKEEIESPLHKKIFQNKKKYREFIQKIECGE